MPTKIPAIACSTHPPKKPRMRVPDEMLPGVIIAFGRSVIKPQNAAAPNQPITNINPRNIRINRSLYYRYEFENDSMEMACTKISFDTRGGGFVG
jgi:hypothetical protein